MGLFDEITKPFKKVTKGIGDVGESLYKESERFVKSGGIGMKLLNPEQPNYSQMYKDIQANLQQPTANPRRRQTVRSGGGTFLTQQANRKYTLG